MRVIHKEPNNNLSFDFYSGDLDSKLNSQLFSDEFYRSIIETNSFERLKDVSFLGAIDYIYKKNKSNRYTHSLDVAKLALFISNERRYNKEIERHLVTAALLHDIGHAPLSHSIESCFNSEFGIDHHSVSSDLISGKTKDKSINKTIKNMVDVSIVLELISQKCTEDFSDVFSSKINIDTIDGIHKSLLTTGKDVRYDKYNVAKSALANFSGDSVKVLDEFWKSKDFVYNSLITNGIGAIADYLSKEHFSENKNRINESHFLKKESVFLKGSKPIFQGFTKKLQSINVLKDDETDKNIKKLEFSILSRKYSINKEHKGEKNISELISNRYICTKTKEERKLSYALTTANPQINLL